MSLSAALLAGGESRRMGRDKATQIFRGRPLWQRQLEALRCVKAKEIFVSAKRDPAWRPDGVEFVADANPSHGPLSGIAAVLSHSASDHLLVLAIDMPFMTGEYLDRLIRRIRPGRGVVPMIENRAEPLAAIYPRDCCNEIQAVLGGVDFSLQPVIRNLVATDQLLPVPVSPSETALFRNLNEPSDLETSPL